MFLLISVLASRYSVTPAGTLALCIALPLAYANPRLALILLFAAGFLPYVWGLPVTCGFAISAALSPMLLFGGKRTFQEMPTTLFGLLSVLAILIAATYPFQKSADLAFLFFGLLGMAQAVHLIRKASELSCPLGESIVSPARIAFQDFALSLTAAFLLPFFCNMTLLLNSPYLIFKEHIKSLMTGRITVGYMEPNVVAAYLTALFVVLIIGPKLKGRAGFWHAGHILLVVAVLIAIVASGSRTALLLALAFSIVAFIAGVVKIASGSASSHLCWRSVVFVSLCVTLCFSAIVGVSAATSKVSVGAIQRLTGTSSLEQTGRPKSLRDASDRLDAIPYTGMDESDYVRRTARHSPHSSLVATVMFAGLWLAIPIFALMLFPVFDCLCGLRLSDAPLLAIFLFVLFLGTQTIPLVSDRGALVLTGAWFAFSRLPRRNERIKLQLVAL